MAFNIFGSGRTGANLARVKAARAAYVKAGRSATGRKGNAEAKKLARELDEAQEVDDVMRAAETDRPSSFNQKIAKDRAARRKQIAGIRRGY